MKKTTGETCPLCRGSMNEQCYQMVCEKCTEKITAIGPEGICRLLLEVFPITYCHAKAESLLDIFGHRTHPFSDFLSVVCQYASRSIEANRKIEDGEDTLKKLAAKIKKTKHTLKGLHDTHDSLHKKLEKAHY